MEILKTSTIWQKNIIADVRVFNMLRRSHEGLTGITKDNYPGLPEELKEFNYYYDDGETGHVIMAIPKCLLKEAEQDGDLDMYECPFPVKYVIEKGCEIYKNHIICDAKYNPIFGLEIEHKWFETNKIKEYRMKTGMSRAEMSRQFEIPIRTLEDWESGKSDPPHWAEKLILEKLQTLCTEK